MTTRNVSEKQKTQIKNLYYGTFILLLPMVGALYFLSTLQEEEIIEFDDSFLYEERENNINLQNVSTNAYSALIFDLNNSQILYEKNADILLPLASITKLVTAKVADDFIDSPYVSISKMQDFPQYGDSSLFEGQRWNTEDLITYTLLTSSNDAAHSLLVNASNQPSTFTQKMNQLALSAGLVQTYFHNETGLDNDEMRIPGSRGTAKEVGKLLKYLFEEDFELFQRTRYTQTKVTTPFGIQTISNTNSRANQIIGLMMSKTGYTDLAGGNLAIVADMGLHDPVAFVVLKSSREARFEDVFKLQEEYFAQVRETLR